MMLSSSLAWNIFLTFYTLFQCFFILFEHFLFLKKGLGFLGVYYWRNGYKFERFKCLRMCFGYKFSTVYLKIVIKISPLFLIKLSRFPFLFAIMIFSILILWVKLKKLKNKGLYIISVLKKYVVLNEDSCDNEL